MQYPFDMVCNLIGEFFLPRLKGRGRGTTVSYKEDSEEKTDSDDLVDVEYTEPDPAVVDNSETIERVLAKRRGKKGGQLVTS